MQEVFAETSGQTNEASASLERAFHRKTVEVQMMLHAVSPSREMESALHRVHFEDPVCTVLGTSVAG
jgi:hypothetical protein